MKITRYKHACCILEIAQKKLVIDPGIYTDTFGGFDNIVVVVVTHEHKDHFSAEYVEQIIAHNPDVKIFSTEKVAQALQSSSVTVVSNGDEHIVGPFTLHFTGDKHAAAHPDWPTVENRGVRVNQDFYYAGDSLAPPDKPIKVLAVPISYAWFKMEYAMNYAAAIHPEVCFTLHDRKLSTAGVETANKWIQRACEANGISFQPLSPGDHLDI